MGEIADPKVRQATPACQAAAAETSREKAKIERIKARSGDSELLGQALAGRPVALVQADDGPQLVDLETGEAVDHPAGAGMMDRLATLHLMAGAAGNAWTGQATDWTAGGHLWVPPTRLDPCSQATLRTRARRRARAGVARAEEALAPEERDARSRGMRAKGRRTAAYFAWSFITLTHPHAGRTDDVAEVALQNRALSLLRKRLFWTSRVKATVKAIENKRLWTGPHVHSHLMVLAKYMDRGELQREWAECLEVAVRDIYQEEVKYEPERLNVWISQIRTASKKVRSDRDLRAAHEAGQAVSLEEALQEVVKYVTKADDLVVDEADGLGPCLRLPRNQLEALCEVERWPRMFELWGAAREPGRPDREEEAAAAWDAFQRPEDRAAGLVHCRLGLEWAADLAFGAPRAGEAGYLDTACLSDGDPFGEGAYKSFLTLEWETLPLERPPKPPRGRVTGTKVKPLTIREAMRCLSFRDWLRLVVRRVERSHEITIQRLQRRGYALTSEGSGLLPVSSRRTIETLDEKHEGRIVKPRGVDNGAWVV